MRSHRGGWLGSWVLGAIFVVAPSVATTVHAQPGFGPDPFWPYNSQYAPYTTAIGPAAPDGGQGSSMLGRQGNAAANQFQQYLDSLPGPGRNVTDRSGVGVPYFRGSVDPAFGFREYRPNAIANRGFEEKQRDVTEKYFAYFSEKDPKKRAKLLRDYQEAKREADRELSPRAQTPSRILEEASRNRTASGVARASRATDGDLANLLALPHEPGTINRSGRPAARRSTDGPASARSSFVPAAPPIPSMPGARTGARTRSTPSSVLGRARAMDDRTRRSPGATRSQRSTPPPYLPARTGP
ncbi:MAG: hypothetical protein ACLQGP_18110 [Isosphaeraceae bacterium]